MPVVLQTTVMLQNIWEPRRAAELIAAERVTFISASTPFLFDLTDAVGGGRCDVSSLRIFRADFARAGRARIEKRSGRPSYRPRA
jgi:cyclohexanecarboxylate-CoA ligase